MKLGKKSNARLGFLIAAAAVVCGLVNLNARAAEDIDPFAGDWAVAATTQMSGGQPVSYDAATNFVAATLSSAGAPIEVRGVGRLLAKDEVRITAYDTEIESPFERFWFVFADDAPGALWSHPCRYVCISEDGRTYAVREGRFWPEIVRKADGKPIWMLPSVNARPPVSLAAVKRAVYAATPKDAYDLSKYYAGDISHSYFFLFCGGQNAVNNHIFFWADTAMFYSTLTKKYKVPADHIRVLMSDGLSDEVDACLGEYSNGEPILVSSPTDLDGDGVADVNGTAYFDDMSRELQAYASSLTADDQLFVFMTSHGALNMDGTKSAILAHNGGRCIWDYQIAEWSKDIPCPVAFAIQACNSGGFVDDLTAIPNRMVATACRQDEYAWGNRPYVAAPWSGSGIGKTGAYSTWARQFNSAVRGFAPASISGNDYPWNDGASCAAAVDADGDGRASFSEAATYATAHDENRNVEHPQYGESAAGLGAKFFVLKPSSGESSSEDAPDDPDKPLRVLAIGNSFSRQVCDYLGHVKTSLGVNIDFMNLYIGSGQLSQHWNGHDKAGTYNEFNLGAWETAGSPVTAMTPAKNSLDDVLAAEQWDVVTLQQASNYSTDLSSSEPYFGNLVSLIRTKAPTAKIYVHQTWSWSPRHAEISTYEDSDAMYDRLRANYASVKAAYNLDGIIPSGFAAQLCRHLYSHELQTSDGSHFEMTGKYMQACLWAGVLTGKDVTTVADLPNAANKSLNELSPALYGQLRDCAQRASVATDLTAYKLQPIVQPRRIGLKRAASVSKSVWTAGEAAATVTAPTFLSGDATKTAAFTRNGGTPTAWNGGALPTEPGLYVLTWTVPAKAGYYPEGSTSVSFRILAAGEDVNVLPGEPVRTATAWGYTYAQTVGQSSYGYAVFTDTSKAHEIALPSGVQRFDALVVGGGGGGGIGGGGGGEVVERLAIAAPSGALTVRVGRGGAGRADVTWNSSASLAESGTASSLAATGFTTLTAGGGGAGADFNNAGSAGSANGGGGAPRYNYNVKAESAPGQGTLHNGGLATSAFVGGGGGGGAGAGAGGGDSAITSRWDNNQAAGDGGAGVLSAITGKTYGGGGGGGIRGRVNDGGLGVDGGGNGSTAGILYPEWPVAATAGEDGRGGGGGGGGLNASGGNSPGAKGGDGVVILRWEGSGEIQPPEEPSCTPTLTTPANYAEVPTLNAEIKAFNALSESEKSTILLTDANNESYRQALSAAYKTGLPGVPLAWSGTTGACTVRVYRERDDKLVFESESSTGTATFWDPEIGRNYRWTVTCGGTTVIGYFHTEAEGPRLVNEARCGGTNGRDLGGWRTTDGKVVKQGLVFRAGMFDDFQASDLVWWSDVLGVKIDLDLRKTINGEPIPDSSPIPGATLYNSYRAKGCMYCPDLYADCFSDTGDPSTYHFKEAVWYNFEQVSQSANYPLVFHCTAGRDRTGCFAYLLGAILGVSENDLATDFYTSWASQGWIDRSSTNERNMQKWLPAFTTALKKAYPDATYPTVKAKAEQYVKDCCKKATGSDAAAVTAIAAFRTQMLEEPETPHLDPSIDPSGFDPYVADNNTLQFLDTTQLMDFVATRDYTVAGIIFANKTKTRISGGKTITVNSTNDEILDGSNRRIFIGGTELTVTGAGTAVKVNPQTHLGQSSNMSITVADGASFENTKWNFSDNGGYALVATGEGSLLAMTLQCGSTWIDVVSGYRFEASDGATLKITRGNYSLDFKNADHGLVVTADGGTLALTGVKVTAGAPTVTLAGGGTMAFDTFTPAGGTLALKPDASWNAATPHLTTTGNLSFKGEVVIDVSALGEFTGARKLLVAQAGGSATFAPTKVTLTGAADGVTAACSVEGKDVFVTLSAPVTPVEPEEDTYYFIGSDSSGNSFVGSSAGASNGWNTDPDATVALAHTVSSEYDYVFDAKGLWRTLGTHQNNDSETFQGHSLTLKNGAALQSTGISGEKTVTVNDLRISGTGGMINPQAQWGKDAQASLVFGGAISVDAGSVLKFYPCIATVIDASIAGEGSLSLTTMKQYYVKRLTLAGDMSGFSGSFTTGVDDDGTAARLEKLVVSGGFGGTVESLPILDNGAAFNYEGLVDGATKGLKVGAVDGAVDERVKNSIVLYSPDFDFTAEDLPLMTFPAGTTVKATDFKVYHSTSADGAKEAFTDLHVRENDDGTKTLLSSASQDEPPEEPVAPPVGQRKLGMFLDYAGALSADFYCDFIRDHLAPNGFDTLVLLIDMNFGFESRPGVGDGRTTKEDVAKMAEVCREHGIELIPALELLGHQSVDRSYGILKAYPELDESYSKAKVEENYARSLCPKQPLSLEVACDLMDDLVEAAGSKAIHICCDEVFEIGVCDLCKDTDHGTLFADWVNALNRHNRANGVETMIWGDRLIKRSGTPYSKWEASENGTDTALALLDRDVVICDWHYESTTTFPSVELFTEAGFRTWICPYHNLESAKKFVAYADAHEVGGNVAGVMLTVWVHPLDYVAALRGDSEWVDVNGTRKPVSQQSLGCAAVFNFLARTEAPSAEPDTLTFAANETTNFVLKSDRALKGLVFGGGSKVTISGGYTLTVNSDDDALMDGYQRLFLGDTELTVTGKGTALAVNPKVQLGQSSDTSITARDGASFTNTKWAFSDNGGYTLVATGEGSLIAMTLQNEKGWHVVDTGYRFEASDGATLKITRGNYSLDFKNANHNLEIVADGGTATLTGVKVTAGAPTVTLAGNGTAAFDTFTPAGGTLALVPDANWSAETPRLTTTGNLTLGAGVAYTVDVSALTASATPLKLAVAKAGGTLSFTVPTAAVALTGKSAERWQAGLTQEGKVLFLTLTALSEPRPTVDGQEVEPDKVFDFAREAKPITYPDMPEVSGAEGNQRIDFGGASVEVPRHYTASVEGCVITIALNRNAAPAIADSDDGKEKGIALKDGQVKIHFTPQAEGLFYTLESAPEPQGEWAPAKGPQAETDFSVPVDGEKRFYRIKVSD